MRTLNLAIVLGATLLAVSSAAATECTDQMREERYVTLQGLIEEKPERAEKLEGLAAEVEAEMGGEPTAEQECDALDKLLEKLAAS